MMEVEQIDDAVTIDEMRAAIYKHRWHEPLTREIMDAADYRGMSGEDRYSLLAYHALKQLAFYKNYYIHDAMISSMLKPIVVEMPEHKDEA